jgi:hypothetical protein
MRQPYGHATHGALHLRLGSPGTERGHGLVPDAYWWDAHAAGEAMGGPVLLVLVADRGHIAVAQLLRADQLAAYRAADLPRRDQTAFTTTFLHGTTTYGADLPSALDHALDLLPATSDPAR